MRQSRTSSACVLLLVLFSCRKSDSRDPDCGARLASKTASLLSADTNVAAAADGADAVTLDLLLADTNSNPLADAPVEWRVPTECAILRALATTDQSGHATADLACRQPGSQSATAVACGIAISLTATFAEPTWHHPASGLDGAVFVQVVAGRASQPNRVYAVGSGSVYRSEDSGVTWSRTAPAPVAVASVAVTPAEEVIAVGSGLVFRSPDAGETWLPISAGTDGAVRRVVAGPDGILWASSDRAALFVTPDSGVSWTALGTAPALALESSEVDVGMLFAFGGSPAVYVSGNGGASFARFELPNSAFTPPTGVSAVAPDPTASSSALAFADLLPFMSSAIGSTTSAYETVDQGATWSARGILPGRVTAVARALDGAYAGIFNYHATPFPGAVQRGILKSEDHGLTWKTAGAGNRTIVSLAVHPTHPGVAYAVTHRGEVLRTDSGGM